MNVRLKAVLAGFLFLFFPCFLFAQSGGAADDIKSLHVVLAELYNKLMPLCAELIGVGRGIAGFAALWYIAARVWGHLSRAEPIDFYPLFRPFIIGFAILIFPSVITMINGVMQPTVTGTAKMVDKADESVAALLKQKEEAIKKTDVWQMYVGPTGEGDREQWYKYTHDGKPSTDEGFFASVGNDIRFAFAKASYNFRNAIKEVIAEVLQLLFAAVSLCINTMRTFNLIILAILGPLVFGLSVFDGFQHTLKHWLARYINVFLWLPIAQIFGAVIATIQAEMLKIDLTQIGQTGDTFFSRTDLGYMVFLIIGIYGYTTIPNIANHIMFVGGDALTGKMTAAIGGVAGAAGGAAMGAAGMAGKAAGAAADGFGDLMFADNNSVEAGLRNLYNAPDNIKDGYNSGSTGKGLAADAGRAYGHMANKLKGGDTS
ncbi:Bacteroides conjugative transposon TraJ protein [Chitinophaga jiangningensis]|uniref:Bacteroides conjugative transposon TraJ protein n=1 Tax=Chitinophaga jiangningensis TaxID=1419482 RepID=A0A1M6XX24_9BACT|nr:conjugative transposon protein TraJ [Chitinophaga jiangningensis]SHL10419.1 Bacteroides conjugative transposon TraJ protein [Chitinophaga jiangningensis]